MENVLALKKKRDFAESFLEDWKRLGPMLRKCEELEGAKLEQHRRELDDLTSTLARQALRMQRLLDATTRIDYKLPLSWTVVQNYRVIPNIILLARGRSHERREFWFNYPKSITLLEMYVGDLDLQLEGWYWKVVNPLYWLRLMISIISRGLLTGAFSLFKVSSVTVERVMESTLYKLVEVLAALGGAIGFIYFIYFVIKGLGLISGP